MPTRFARRVADILGYRDVVDGTERSLNELTIDHKLPMSRWTKEVSRLQTDYQNMSDDDIRANFQLLKKSNGSISHNLLKSRACEVCFQRGRRGTPFGVVYFYDGGPNWQPEDKQDPRGCIGCGWYDLDQWRIRLNETLREKTTERHTTST